MRDDLVKGGKEGRRGQRINHGKKGDGEERARRGVPLVGPMKWILHVQEVEIMEHDFHVTFAHVHLRSRWTRRSPSTTADGRFTHGCALLHAHHQIS